MGVQGHPEIGAGGGVLASSHRPPGSWLVETVLRMGGLSPKWFKCPPPLLSLLQLDLGGFSPKLGVGAPGVTAVGGCWGWC